jgi:hypothetical protein
MKNKIFLFKVLLFTMSVLIFSSCERKTDETLTGKWAYTTESKPRGYVINEITFNNDLSFIKRITWYGIYEGQDLDELSGWTEITGNFEVNENNLIITANKSVSYDSFFSTDPVTTIKTEILYTNCTFDIDEKTLELRYLTFPADAPVQTKCLYKKQND